MKCFLLSLALLELLLWHKGSALFLNEDCAWTDDEVVPTNTPWIAVVRSRFFTCAGALITKNYVLTTAQCIYGQRGPMFVQLGERHFNVSRGIMHRGYGVQPGPNDIGLLKLDGEVNYSTDHIRPICVLMDAASVLQNINRFSAFGWRKPKAGDDSPVLTTHQLRRLPSEKCHSDMLPLTNKQFCADNEVGDGTCFGDAGGPLAVIINNRPVQVGITSYGPKSCNGPAVHTDVASYTRWIASIVRF